MSSDRTDGALLVAWSNGICVWRPDGTAFAWRVDGCFVSNGQHLLDGGFSLPPVHHDLAIRPLDVLRYDNRRRVDVSIPFAGTVLVLPQPSGAQIQLRFTDRGVFFCFPDGGDETFASHGAMRERMGSGGWSSVR